MNASNYGINSFDIAIIEMSLPYLPHHMAEENVLVGWNDRKTAYHCADGVEVRMKRQETLRFTRKEEVRNLWPK